MSTDTSTEFCSSVDSSNTSTDLASAFISFSSTAFSAYSSVDNAAFVASTSTDRFQLLLFNYFQLFTYKLTTQLPTGLQTFWHETFFNFLINCTSIGWRLTMYVQYISKAVRGAVPLWRWLLGTLWSCRWHRWVYRPLRTQPWWSR